MGKVIVLGIDGASFDLLYPLIEQGKLPNLTHVIRKGVHGVLHSTIPPYSAQAWVSMMTGKDPAKHGVVDFFIRGFDGAHHGFVNSTHIHSKAIWDILSRHGKRVGIINVPLTYPPMPTNGYMVSGFLTPRNPKDYTYPSELREEILSVTGVYDPDPFDFASARDLDTFVRWMGIREQAAVYLQEKHPVDLFISVIQALDQLQHKFWDILIDKGARSNSEGSSIWQTAKRCYEIMDTVIGHRLNSQDEETTLFLVSDHGFQTAQRLFHVNYWLAEQGFLDFQRGRIGWSKSVLARLGLTHENIKVLVRRLDPMGLRRLVGRLTRANVASRLGDTLAVPIDWSHTLAYSGSRTSEGIYINLKGREPQGIVEPGAPYEELRERIMAALAALIDPDTGQPVVSAVYRREDVHAGPFLHLMPDILFSLDNRPYLTSDSTTARRVFEPLAQDDVRGRHHSQGIFAAIGPHIVSGLKLKQVNITDVAPTILYAMDLPIPVDMDGRVLEEAFTAEYRQAHPIHYEESDIDRVTTGPEVSPYTEEEDAEMQRRLQGLGYIS